MKVYVATTMLHNLPEEVSLGEIEVRVYSTLQKAKDEMSAKRGGSVDWKTAYDPDDGRECGLSAELSGEYAEEIVIVEREVDASD